MPSLPNSAAADMYRSLFKFGIFNAVQSSCFHKVIDTDENMVISAPTGSGKTVLFELAIIRMLTQVGGNTKTSKCIYVAPTKTQVLCSEKCRDWTTKFQPLGVDCCQLTGDIVHFRKSAWGSTRDATIISSVRLVVVSATVLNIKDVASWISNGTPNGSATIKKFGEEHRPCKLSKFMYEIPQKREQNDFVFQRTLDYHLYDILQQHSANKPMLVFCSTRTGVMMTTKQILKNYENVSHNKQTLPWLKPPSIKAKFENRELRELAVCRIGVHHGGMSMDDHQTIEELYIKKIIRVVVSTSTLAVGVNLPAHTVMIKGVKVFRNNTCQEYSDLDIMQMMGHALEAITSAEDTVECDFVRFSDIGLRGGEKGVYDKLHVHKDIRYQIKKIEKPADKIFVLIQLNSYLVWPAIVEVAIVTKAGSLLKSGLEVMRCFNAKAWEDRYMVMRQVERIGEKSLKVLVKHNITSIDVLRKQDQLCLEALLNHRPPFGLEVLAAMQQFPQYTLQISEVAISSHGDKKPLEVEILVDCGLLNGTVIKPKNVKTREVDMTMVLILTSDLDIMDFRRYPMEELKETKRITVSVQLTKPSQSITETIAGVAVTECYKLNVGTKYYPNMLTSGTNFMVELLSPVSEAYKSNHYATTKDFLLYGLEDNVDFWNMGPDDEDSVEVELPTAKLKPPPAIKPAATQANVFKHCEEQQKTSAKIAPRNTMATMQNRHK
ncbi:P-loop containing nucleoside triphosphate hydrolase protein [Laetiporus sulphureus 93-53]|uniref:p-loop containing nucleoside triphosphate hydrolase protein n=1 Tax=Laetiporus sulphureus 93-53 TaxID=1314785 RepID=A0A165EV52_9APHY|nr:P-loop containing nucleoside triphosphate hydrolase protein [Laetiporus sulphureus 93-53]KZT07825.1 P-loop containing nucleoside triphosphate hydrolase protein [Laetiporus sulphureus 93-53]